MDTVIHKADTRGTANHGWLQSFHSFSFGNYHDPARINFGALRVLNDDTVAAGMGFGKHRHEDMEIISIPLFGDLEHKDSMDNTTVIKAGDIQVMSAGTGVYHSEYNKNKDREVKFLQIWIIPKERGVTPRYDQITLPQNTLKNEWYQIVSPNADEQGVWIHQDAWFSLGQFDAGVEREYSLHNPKNGVYLFVLEGDIMCNDHSLHRRDAIGIWNTDRITIETTKASKVLLIEVPMSFLKGVNEP
ncbi:pirin family protein [Aquimarina sp. W85]|uniref:pirin family protein n=1 Tax=Aquimarina rhodophyticola TaxID=3342246 RepID=UPI00367079E9